MFEYHHKKGCRQVKLPDGRMLEDGQKVMYEDGWYAVDLSRQDQNRVLIRPVFPMLEGYTRAKHPVWARPEWITSEAEILFQKSLKGI